MYLKKTEPLFDETGNGAGAAAPSAPAAAPAPTPEKSGSTVLSSQEIADLFSGKSPAPVSDTGVPSKPPEAGATTAPGPGPTASAPSAQPAAPAENPEQALLKKQLADAQTLLQQYQQLHSAQSPAQQPAQPAGDGVPPYAFNVPPQLLQMLESEVPAERQQAVGAIMTGTARAVHQTMLGEFSKVLEGIPTLIQQAIQHNARSQQIFHDFYGKFPDLNIPALRPLVIGVAEQVVKESGANEWSAQIRDVIGQRVMAMLGRAPQGAPAPAPTPAPIMAGGAPRPAVSDNSIASQIRELMQR